MDFLHQELRRTIRWYDAWHRGAHSSIATWALFALVAILFTTSLTRTIQNDFDYGQLAAQVPALPAGVANNLPMAIPENARAKLLHNEALGQLSNYMRTPRSETVIPPLKKSLADRAVALRELALSHPDYARRFLFNNEVRELIPEAARMYAEKTVELSGTYKIILVTESISEDGESSHEEYYLETSETEQYRLALTEQEAYSVEPGSQLTISGADLGEKFIIPTSFIAAEEVDTGDMVGEVLGAATPTTKKIAIVAFNFRNDVSQPHTIDELRKRIFTDPISVNSYFKEASFGTWRIEGRDRVDGDVYGWVTIDADAQNNCDFNNWASLANKKLSAEGYRISGYDHVQYFFPSTYTKCPWSGLAEMPGDTSWIRGAYSISTGVHELGHNFGFHHASSYGCSVATSQTGTCIPSEYGDSHDVMGSGGRRHTNNFNKSKYWIPEHKIETVSQPGSYTLGAVEFDGSSPQVFRIKRPFAYGSSYADGYYQLEYRTPFGFDDIYAWTPSLRDNVHVRLVNSNYLTGSYKTYWVTSIAPGGTFSDQEAGLTIRHTGTSTNGALLDISMSEPLCVPATPLAAISPSGQWGSAGSVLSYTVTVKNLNGTNCGDTTFAVTPTLPEGFAQNPPTLEFSLAPNAMQSATVQISSPLSAMSAAYTLTQTATNGADVSLRASASANYNVMPTDTNSPTVNIVNPLANTTITTRRETVTVQADDESGISQIDISIGGKRVKSCTAINTCTYTWNTGRLSKGTHTVSATAFDASPQKNRTDTEVTVTK